MDFFIDKEARSWFQGISDEFGSAHGSRPAPDFDAFYFCFIAGIARRRKKHLSVGQTRQLVNYFPGVYDGRGSLLVALFLSRVLESRGIDSVERQNVRKVVSDLVHPQSENFLSDEGVREFNEYAFGGFEVLQEWFDTRPTSLDVFLRTFKRRIDEAIPT